MNFEEQVEIIDVSKFNEDGKLNQFILDLDLNDNKDIEDQTLNILIKAHKDGLVKVFIEDICKEQYFGGCDQYALFLGIILKVLDKTREISILDSAEIVYDKFIQGKIEVIRESKYPDKDYIPHSYLSVKINDEKVILSPKYTNLGFGKIESDIEEKYHCKLEGNMKFAHISNSKKSGLFLPYVKNEDRKYNYNEFPCHVKNKKKFVKAYKSYIKRELK